MIEIVIQGLNMKTVNALIWASAVLAKVGVISLILTTLMGIATILISLLGD